jgi:hypothetical protein
MQVVFMNTFDRVDGDRTVMGASVSICENDGQWLVLWTEGEEETVTWYEGLSWEEMLAAFRHGIAMKMGEGFQPIIDGMLDERKASLGGMIMMMQCYGELNSDPVLFEELREWRRKTAAQQRKSAYMIATNRVLNMISAFKPHTEMELAQIPGWGDTKMKAYAEQVLAITSKHSRETVFPLDWVTSALDTKQYLQWMYRQKELKYKGQMERHQEKRLILDAISQGRSLSELETELEMTRRNLLDRIEQLETEGYDMEPIVETELALMPMEERQSVLEAFDAVGDKYLKPVMQHVYGTEGASDKPLDLVYDRLRMLRLTYRRTKKHEAV